MLNFKLLFSLATLLLLSCGPNIKEVMDSWLGQSKHELIRSWGYPDSVSQDEHGNEILVYAQHFTLGDEDFAYTFQKRQMFFINKQTNRIFKWMIDRK